MSRALKRALEAPNKGGLTYTTVNINNIALGLKELIKALFAAAKRASEKVKVVPVSNPLLVNLPSTRQQRERPPGKDCRKWAGPLGCASPESPIYRLGS